MVEFHNVFIAMILIITIYMYISNKNNEVKYEISTFDNKKYLVRNREDSGEAANLLAKIRYNLIQLCDNLKKEYPDKTDIKRLIYKFNPNSITETGKNSKYTSYSVNKGEKIVLCLRARDDEEKLIDENTLMFVAIHEISHIMTKSIGHTKEFWRNFKFLLKHAIKQNLYKHVDYNSYPKKYCGITITDTPLNDNNL